RRSDKAEAPGSNPGSPTSTPAQRSPAGGRVVVVLVWARRRADTSLVSILAFLAVLLAALAAPTLVGLAPAAMLRHVSADVRVALVLPVAAAIMACTGPLTVLGAPIRAVAVALAAAGAAGIVAARHDLRALAAGVGAPCLVALVALTLASIPAFEGRSWDATS